MSRAPLEEMRTRVGLEEFSLTNTWPTDFPGNYPGYDDAWNMQKFKKNFKIKIVRLEEMHLEFDIIGADASLVNAFRRILIAEVPTMAVEKVFIYNNTSIIQDEVLAHRLGLIPFKADSRYFEYKHEGDKDGTPEDTLEFTLKVRCCKRPTKESNKEDSEDEEYLNKNVYSRSIKWVPLGNQQSLYKENEVGPVDGKILIAKLRPGHEIDVKMHCVKGIGKDHAKFQPVAPVSYRLLPEIILTREFKDDQAYQLQQCFSKGVIEIEEKNGVKYAKVANARADMCSRNVFRLDDLKDGVKLNKVRDHFIFSIESTGALHSDDLFFEAIKVLKTKCRAFLDELTHDKQTM